MQRKRQQLVQLVLVVLWLQAVVLARHRQGPQLQRRMAIAVLQTVQYRQRLQQQLLWMCLVMGCLSLGTSTDRHS